MNAREMVYCRLCGRAYLDKPDLVQHLYWQHEVLPNEHTLAGQHLTLRATDYSLDDEPHRPPGHTPERRHRLSL